MEPDPLTTETLRSRLLEPAGPMCRVEVVGETGSTNADVLADRDWPDRSVLIANHQTAGRGRLGRVWQAPPGSALTLTMVLRPRSRAGLGWVPLLAGLGVVRALARDGLAVGLKWPNDVLASPTGASDLPRWGTERKVAGILTQANSLGDVVAIGIGINVSQSADDLPVPWATSVRLAGGLSERTEVAAHVVTEVQSLLDQWQDVAGVVPEQVTDAVRSVCMTIGRRVRVDGAGGQGLVGVALDLAEDGVLVIRDDDGISHRISAGDVIHLRAD